MAVGKGRDQGKSTFARQFFTDHKDASREDLNKAWKSAGHEGDISESSVYKIRSELNLTGQRGAGGAKKAMGPKGKAKPMPKPTQGKPEVASTPARSQEEEREIPVPTKAPASVSNGLGHRARVLDRVEDGIDDLIVELKQLGGMEETLETLRKVRRVIVRSHEG